MDNQNDDLKTVMVRVLMTPLLHKLITEAAGGRGAVSAWIRGACTARLTAEQANPEAIRTATARERDAVVAHAAAINDPLLTAGRVIPLRRAADIFSDSP